MTHQPFCVSIFSLSHQGASAGVFEVLHTNSVEQFVIEVFSHLINMYVDIVGILQMHELLGVLIVLSNQDINFFVKFLLRAESYSNSSLLTPV